MSQFAGAQPPQVADSDLIVMAINRLERAVVKMQTLEYDDLLREHLTRAAEMLAWVAKNIWMRDAVDAPESGPPLTHTDLYHELQALMDSLDTAVTAEAAAKAFRTLADDVERQGLHTPDEGDA